MHRRYLLFIPLLAALVCALPSPAFASRTRTPVRIAKPDPADATVAGLELRLVKKKATASAISAAVKLPKGVTVVAVVAKQKRSDRVRGVIVVLRKADAVAAAHSSASVVTVDLKHAAIPSGYRTTLAVKQRRNVLDPGRSFRCRSWFRTSDLKKAVSLGGPDLPGLSTRDAIADACASARSTEPYAGENVFRSALNARTGFLTWTRDAQVPNQVDGSASFNYPIGSFTVLADKGHSFTSCSFAGGTCQLLKKRHANDYAVFRPAGSPVARDTPMAFGLVVAPSSANSLPFDFFGVSPAGTRYGPLLTTGP